MEGIVDWAQCRGQEQDLLVVYRLLVTTIDLTRNIVE